MSPAFWESIGMCVGILFGGGFAIALMYACLKGPPDDDRPRGGGMVE